MPMAGKSHGGPKSKSSRIRGIILLIQPPQEVRKPCDRAMDAVLWPAQLKRIVTLTLLWVPVLGAVIPSEAVASTAGMVGPGDCAQFVTDTSGVTVEEVNGDCVITFTRVGNTTWTVPNGLSSVDVLIVAGGGGGGGGNSRAGGGGGAGGLRELFNQSVTAGAQVSISVGSGGAGGAGGDPAVEGNNGGASSFHNEMALGGGGGGRGGRSNLAATQGRTGGSGGGAGSGNSNLGAVSGTTGQGNAGGASGGGTQGAAGGGGAGAAGADGSNSNAPGSGGQGKTSSISTSGATFAVGGDGGSASGGGTAAAGQAGLGSGGVGGAGGSGAGGAGGSGVVVVRFSSAGVSPPAAPAAPGSGDPIDPVQALAACDASPHNGLSVAPGHGPILYVDTGQSQNIDAGYLSYRVTSDTARSDLWVQIEELTGSVVSLVDPSQSAVPLGPMGAGPEGARAAFFLMRASGGTTDPQSQVVRVYRSDPRVGSPAPLYQCDFTLDRVDETIKAAANKVESIEVSSVVRIGDIYTITVQGDSGTIGSGNDDDGRMIWVSPAARSDWPTRALRLETTEVDLFADAARTTRLSTHRDVLRINASTGLTTKNRQYYTAVYTFRVIGVAASAVPIIPTAMISSGRQIKHTDVGSLPTDGSGGTFVIDITEPTVSLEVDKTADEGLALNLDVETARVTYRIELDNGQSDSSVSVDAIVDTPDAKLTFVLGSAQYDGRSLLNPTMSGADLVFAGPLEVPAGQVRALQYQMEFPFDVCDDNDLSFVNTAFARVGDVVIGSSATAKPKVTVSINCGADDVPATTATVQDNVDEGVPPQVVTTPATAVTDTTAQLNGLVDPNGSAGNEVRFVYSQSRDLSSPTEVVLAPTPSPAVTSAYGVTASLTGLTSSTTYYFRIEVGATTGSSPSTYIVGDTLNFTTQDPPKTPEAVTGEASDITSFSAVLAGTINPERVATKVLFEWATTTGSCDENLVATTGSGFLEDEDLDENDPDRVLILDSAAPILMTHTATGLDATQGYCFRIVAAHGANFGTRVEGDWEPFTTLSVQTITFSPPEPDDMVVGDRQLISATSSRGLNTFTFISEDPEICTIVIEDDQVFVQAIAPGECTVRVDEPGDETIEPAFSTQQFTVNQKPLTIVEADIDLTRVKVYDGTTTAAVSVDAADLVGVVSGDDVTLSASATYDNANVGTGKTITVVYTIGGADAGKYIAPGDLVVTNGEITPQPLTISDPDVVEQKVYDATSAAIVTSVGTLSGVLSGDSVTVSATASYDSPVVGVGKTITVVYVLAGDDSANYSAPENFQLSSGVITPKPLTLSGTVVEETKVYDDTTDATVTTAGTLSGVLSGDQVTVSATASYDSKAVGTGKTITVIYTLAGDDSSNYTAPDNLVLTSGVITTDVASQLVLVTQPVGGVSGSELVTQPVVEIRDQWNHRVDDSQAEVTVAIQSGLGGTLSGSKTVTASAGVATFNDLMLAGLVTENYVLRMTADSLSSVDSTNVRVTAGPAAQLLVTAPDEGVIAPQLRNLPFNVLVTLADAQGNPTNNIGGDIVIELSGSTANAGTDGAIDGELLVQLTGSGTTVSATLADGESSVLFESVIYTGLSGTSGGDVTLAATGKAGDGSAANQAGTSDPFSVRDIVLFIVASDASITADGESVTSITVTLTDAASPPVPQAGQPIRISSTSGELSFGNTTVAPDDTFMTGAEGEVAFTLQSSITAGTATVTALCPGACPASVDVDFVAGPATQIAVNDPDNTNNQSATVDTAVAVAPSVRVSDANDNVVAGASVLFTSERGSVDPGTAVITDADGIATVNSWTLGTAAGTNTLTATIVGSDPAVDTSLTATGEAGAAVQYLVSVSNTGPEAGSAVTISAQLADQYGNAVAQPGQTVTWTSTNDGVFSSATTNTNANGVASVAFTTSTAAGTEHVVTAITGENGEINGNSPLITTSSGVPHTISLTGPAEVVAGVPSGDFTLTVVDSNGNPVAVGSTITFDLTSTSAGTVTFNPASSLDIVAGQSTVTFTYTDTEADDQTVTATRAGGGTLVGGSSAGHDLTVKADAAARLVISHVDPASPIKGQATTAVTVQLNDQWGNVATAAEDIPVVLTSNKLFMQYEDSNLSAIQVTAGGTILKDDAELQISWIEFAESSRVVDANGAITYPADTRFTISDGRAGPSILDPFETADFIVTDGTLWRPTQSNDWTLASWEFSNTGGIEWSPVAAGVDLTVFDAGEIVVIPADLDIVMDESVALWNLIVAGSLTIQDGKVLTVRGPDIDVSEEGVWIYGDLMIADGTLALGDSALRVSGEIGHGAEGYLQGTSQSVLEVTGTGEIQFDPNPLQDHQRVASLTLDGADGLTLNSDLVVESALSLTRGVLQVSTDHELAYRGNNPISVGTGFIDGALRRLNWQGDEFLYPVGSDGAYAPVILTFIAGDAGGADIVGWTGACAPPSESDRPEGWDLDINRMLARCWRLQPASAMGTIEYDVDLDFQDDEVPPSADQSELTVRKLSPAPQPGQGGPPVANSQRPWSVPPGLARRSGEDAVPGLANRPQEPRGRLRGEGFDSFSEFYVGMQASGITLTNTQPPAVSGMPLFPQTLTADTGDWSGSEPLQFSVQWLRCDSQGLNCVAIVGATELSYTLQLADIGRTLVVEVTASDGTNTLTEQSASTPTIIGPALNDDGELIQPAPGETLIIEDGQPVLIEQDVSGDWLIRLRTPDGRFVTAFGALNADGSQISDVDASATLTLFLKERVFVSGSGFKPNSKVDVWLFSTPTYLGEVDVDGNGDFEGTLTVPETVSVGPHTLQVTGLSADDKSRSISVGVMVAERDQISDAGTPPANQSDGNNLAHPIPINQWFWLLALMLSLWLASVSRFGKVRRG